MHYYIDGYINILTYTLISKIKHIKQYMFEWNYIASLGIYIYTFV